MKTSGILFFGPRFRKPARKALSNSLSNPDAAFRAGLRKLGPKNKIPEVFITKKAKNMNHGSPLFPTIQKEVLLQPVHGTLPAKQTQSGHHAGVGHTNILSGKVNLPPQILNLLLTSYEHPRPSWLHV